MLFDKAVPATNTRLPGFFFQPASVDGASVGGAGSVGAPVERGVVAFARPAWRTGAARLTGLEKLASFCPDWKVLSWTTRAADDVAWLQGELAGLEETAAAWLDCCFAPGPWPGLWWREPAAWGAAHRGWILYCCQGARTFSTSSRSCPTACATASPSRRPSPPAPSAPASSSSRSCSDNPRLRVVLNGTAYLYIQAERRLDVCPLSNINITM
jgi:hypothetical protein